MLFCCCCCFKQRSLPLTHTVRHTHTHRHNETANRHTHTHTREDTVATLLLLRPLLFRPLCRDETSTSPSQSTRGGGAALATFRFKGTSFSILYFKRPRSSVLRMKQRKFHLSRTTKTIYSCTHTNTLHVQAKHAQTRCAFECQNSNILKDI